MRDNIDSGLLLHSVCQNHCVNMSYFEIIKLSFFLYPSSSLLFRPCEAPTNPMLLLHVLLNMLISEGLLDNEDLFFYNGTDMLL